MININDYNNYNNNINSTMYADFDSFIHSNDYLAEKLYIHEYGHTIDSMRYGSAYLFVIGIPSAISAKNNKSIPGKPIGTHRYKSYEMRANRKASAYFNKHYGVDWTPYEPYFPTKL